MNTRPRRSMHGEPGGRRGRGERFQEKGEDGRGEAAKKGKIQGKREDFGWKGKMSSPNAGDSERLKPVGSRSTTAQILLLGSQQHGT